MDPRGAGIVPAIARKDSVAFIEHRLSSVHHAFSSIDPTFDEDNDQFVATGANQIIEIIETPEIIGAKEKFFKRWKKYEQKVAGTGVQVGHSSTSWNSVLSRMQSVLDRHEGKDKRGALDGLRKLMRQCKNLQKPVENWLRCLPKDGWQFSLLCSGLEVLVEAAGRLGEIHEEIADALEQIPTTVSCVEKMRAAYSSEVLESHVRQLLVAILDLYQHALEWFIRNSLLKSGAAMILGKDYARQLVEKHAILKKLETRIDKAASAGLPMSVEELSKDFAQLQLGQDWGHNTADGNSRNHYGNHYGNVYNNFSTADVRTQLWQAELLNRMNTMLNDNQKQAAIVAALELEKQAAAEIRRRLEDQARELAEQQKGLLLRKLHFDEVKTVQDVKTAFERGGIMSVQAQDRTAWILQSSQVETWLFSPKSQTLIINAGDREGHGTHSTVSFFSAMLIHGLEIAKAGVVISWFCGENINASAADMVAHLLGQLLRRGLHLGPLFPLDSLSRKSVKHMTDLLIECMRAQLQVAPIFVVIDSVSFYEDRNRYSQIIRLFKQLSRECKERRHKFNLKVLATSPARCTYLGTFLDDTNPAVLAVPEVVEGANSGINQNALVRGLSDSILHSAQE